MQVKINLLICHKMLGKHLKKKMHFLKKKSDLFSDNNLYVGYTCNHC